MQTISRRNNNRCMRSLWASGGNTKMKKRTISAQTLINNCERHGKIVWKDLKELVNKDRELGAMRKEYLGWNTLRNSHK